jgi:hypothetical protein
MRTKIRTRVAATIAALGLVGMLFAVGSDSTVAARQQIHPEQTSSTCSTPTDEVVPTSVEQVAGLLVGTWIRCDGAPMFGDGSAGEVGVDVVGDRFYRLYRAADGSLIRAEGVDQEGTLTILDTTSTNGPGSYQTNWKLLGQGTAIFRPSFFQSPPVMGLAGMTGTAHYERWTGAAPTPGVPPGTVPSACGNRITPIELTSVAQVQDLLVGSWTHCAGVSAIGSAEGEAGLEFTSDGRFRRLVRSSDGTVTPGSGDGQEGTWTVIDATSMNGPGWYQVSLAVDGRGTYGSFSTFFESSPTSVRFVGMQGVADYVKGQPPNGAPSNPPMPTELPPTGSATVVILLISAALMVLFGLTARSVTRLRR